MYSRLIKAPKNKSFFLFGPRGTGKTTWVKSAFPDALYLDLLEAEIFNDLLANLKKVEQRQPFNGERIPRPVASIDPEDLSRHTYEQTIRGILADLDAKSSALKRKSLLTFPPQ